MAKLSLDSRDFLDTILDSASYPEEQAHEDKRLVTLGSTTAGGVGDALAEASTALGDLGEEQDDDNDLQSIVQASIASTVGGSHGQESTTNPQYAAASAVVTKALEVRRTIDGTKLPAFVYRGVPVTNHALIAEALCLRGTICRRLGDYEESKLMTESALNIFKDLFGRKSLSVADALYEYANYHVDVGVLSEALIPSCCQPRCSSSVPFYEYSGACDN